MGDIAQLPNDGLGQLAGAVIVYVPPIAFGIHNPFKEAFLLGAGTVAALAIAEITYGAEIPTPEWEAQDNDWQAQTVANIGNLNLENTTNTDPTGYEAALADLWRNGFTQEGPSMPGHEGTYWKPNFDGTWDERIYQNGHWVGYHWSYVNRAGNGKAGWAPWWNPWPTRYHVRERDRQKKAQEEALRMYVNGDVRMGKGPGGSTLWARRGIPRNLVPGVPYKVCST